MLRIVLVFAALALAASLTAPSIVGVHDAIEGLDVRRDIRLNLWKWDTESDVPIPSAPAGCSPSPVATESEVTEWPTRMKKEENVTLGGHVIVPTEAKRGLEGIQVDVFLNETKNAPGVFLGTATTDGKGRFFLVTQFPAGLAADRYHIVAHSYEVFRDCKKYLEHWSDPEMDVTSETRIVLDTPETVVLKRSVDVTGVVLDSVGAPVKNERVQLTIGTRKVEVSTDETGRFLYASTPERAGVVTIRARFPGTSHYGDSAAETSVVIVGEDVRIPAAETDQGLVFVRSAPASIEGQVLLPPKSTLAADATITLEGFSVVPCEGCAATRQLPLQIDPEGGFRVDFVVPPTTPAGEYSFTVSGGGLKTAVPFEARVVVPITIDLNLEPGGDFEQRFHGTGRLLDEGGNGVRATILLSTARGDVPLETAADGTVTFSVESDCGRQYARLWYNGSENTQPATTTQNVVVCPLAGWLSPLGIPLWMWATALVVMIVGAYLARRMWRQRSPFLTAGPEMELLIQTPDDEAQGLVGLGERVVAVMQLVEPLPEGHRIRVGLQGSEEEVATEGLQAHAELHAARHGRRAVRAEILDARGRVVTRRTAWVRIVRYAEEIEERYRAFKREHASDTAESVSPREFEAWLAVNAPHIDMATAQRLVAVFEEADYSPREATRVELLHYLRAEARVKGVANHGSP